MYFTLAVKSLFSSFIEFQAKIHGANFYEDIFAYLIVLNIIFLIFRTVV